MLSRLPPRMVFNASVREGWTRDIGRSARDRSGIRVEAQREGHDPRAHRSQARRSHAHRRAPGERESDLDRIGAEEPPVRAGSISSGGILRPARRPGARHAGQVDGQDNGRWKIEFAGIQHQLARNLRLTRELYAFRLPGHDARDRDDSDGRSKSRAGGRARPPEEPRQNHGEKRKRDSTNWQSTYLHDSFLLDRSPSQKS